LLVMAFLKEQFAAVGWAREWSSAVWGSPRSAEKPALRKSGRPRRTASVLERKEQEGDECLDAWQ